MTLALKTVSNFESTIACTRKQAHSDQRTRALVFLDEAARIVHDEELKEDDDESSDLDFLWESLEEEENEGNVLSLSPEPLHSMKRLTFLEEVKQYKYIALNDYSNEEIRKCWYTQVEEEMRTENIQKILSRIEQGKPAKENLTYRGLIGHTKEGRKRLGNNVICVIDAVMDEQDRQWANKCDDVYRIAALSREASAECRSNARLTALKDEVEAREAWNENFMSRNESSLLTIAYNKTRKSPQDSRSKKSKEARRNIPERVLVVSKNSPEQCWRGKYTIL